MRNYLTFNGVDCRTYGVYISGDGTFSAPARAYDFKQIPGSNGDLIGNEKRLENIEVTYPAFVYTNFSQNIGNFRSFLLSQIGYQKLTDTYHPDEYRMACYAAPFEPEVVPGNHAGQFEITFTCKPQRFLNSGDTPQTFSSSGNITNPTAFPARPLLKIVGTGSVTIGGVTMTVSSHPYSSTGMMVDCDTLDAYCIDNNAYVNLNRYLALNKNDYPELTAGTSSVTLSSVTSVQITPRWWQV